MSAADGFDPQAFLAAGVRQLAASSADAAQRSLEAAADAAEMAAWGAFALAWIRERSKDMNIEPALAPDREGSPADFADKMINRRRKYFEIGVAGIAVAPPPRKPET